MTITGKARARAGRIVLPVVLAAACWSGAAARAGTETPNPDPSVVQAPDDLDLPPIDLIGPAPTTQPERKADGPGKPAYQLAGEDNLDYSDTISLAGGAKIRGRVLLISVRKAGADKVTDCPRDRIESVALAGDGGDVVGLTDGAKLEGAITMVRFGSPAGVPRSVKFRREDLAAVTIQAGSPVPGLPGAGRTDADLPAEGSAEQVKQAAARNRELRDACLARLRDAQRRQGQDIETRYSAQIAEVNKRLPADAAKFEAAKTAFLQVKRELERLVKEEANSPVDRKPGLQRQITQVRKDYDKAAKDLEAAQAALKADQEDQKRLPGEKTAELARVAARFSAGAAAVNDAADKHNFIIVLTGGNLTEEQMTRNFELESGGVAAGGTAAAPPADAKAR